MILTILLGLLVLLGTSSIVFGHVVKNGGIDLYAPTPSNRLLFALASPFAFIGGLVAVALGSKWGIAPRPMTLAEMVADIITGWAFVVYGKVPG